MKTPFQLSARILLQVDLENHSSWAANASSQPDVVKARMELAERLRTTLVKRRFQLLSWKGDGGVYASQPELGEGNLDFAYNAAADVAKNFHEWRTLAKNRACLKFRISVHYAGDVYVHQDRGYWASDDLNIFIKHEREIGVSGTVAVTDKVYKHFSDATQMRFTFSRGLHLGASPGHISIERVHYAAIGTETEINKTNDWSFYQWLHRAQLHGAAFQDKLLGPSSLSRATIGDASVLFASFHPESSVSVDFARTKCDAAIDLTRDEKLEWRNLQKQLRDRIKRDGKEDQTKVSACRIALPLTDIPLALIYYKTESWSLVRSFHMLLEKRPTLLKRFGPGALKILENGTPLPGVACCHIIVRTADIIDGGPTVLLCQRQQKGHVGAYSAGRWSLSCEEQMHPGEDVHSCVKRGLGEEFLGSQTPLLNIRIMGAVLERSILNLSIIVLVDVPMTFQEIVEVWQSAVDKDEHRQLTHMPINRDMFNQIAVAHDSVPTGLRPILLPSHPDVYDCTTEWRLHPTSLTRLAFALWAQEARS